MRRYVEQRRLRILGLVFLLAGVARCAYSPNPESGTLKCAPNQVCPEGYHCQSDLKCWKNGEGTTGGAGSTGQGGSSGTGGQGGAGGLAQGTDKFVGHWIFGATGTLMITCNDGSSNTKSLKDDFIDVSLGAASGITLSYYCDWDMDAPPTGTTATIRPNQSCTTTDAASGTIFTWHGTVLTFVTTNGQAATLNATINADYKDTMGATGMCTLKIAGPLTH
jgi:hypothetical protein